MDENAAIDAYFQRHGHLLEAAKVKQGEKRVFHRTRQMLVDQFSAEASKKKTNLSGGKTAMFSIESPYPPCLLHLETLQKIFLKDLLLGTHHRGSFLILRTFGHPFKHNVVAPIMNVVEDEADGIDGLSVYTNSTTLHPDGLLSRGTVLAIKDPYYCAYNDGACLRVYQPSDMIILELGHAMYPEVWKIPEAGSEKTATDCKLEGDAALKQRDYVMANKWYGHGLSLLGPQESNLSRDLRRNRSLARIQLGYYDGAKADALASISDNEDEQSRELNAKAFYRAGSAAYHLRDFQAAHDLFKRQLATAPSLSDAIRQLAKTELTRTEMRLAEEQTGVYDFESMAKASAEDKFNADHADFTRLVEVRQTEGRGRALFATQHISCGSLILCEKAFLIQHDNESTYSVFVDMTARPRQATKGPHTVLCTELVQKIYKNPSLSPRILNLHAGFYPKRDTQVQITSDLPTVDFFQVEKIVRSNSFALPADHGPIPFGNNSVTQDGSPAGQWSRASYFNHACISNGERSFIGDLMIVRANKDILKGSEITISYANVDPNFHARQSLFEATWGFRCDCKLCTLEGNFYNKVGKHQRRNKHIGMSYSHLTNPPEQIIARAKATVEQSEHKYPDPFFEDMPRLGLLNPHVQLMKAYADMKEPDQIQKYASEVLRDLGFKVTVRDSQELQPKIQVDRRNVVTSAWTVKAFLHLSERSRLNDEPELGKEYEKLAREEYLIINGEPTGFDEI